ncbi:defensin-like protein 1 [Vigna radiata var. radiata]|uniref:Defensin-like protein 1 n=1 Tax=Vigna radiata var. radiata TaxID=3916 RepID=A0A1S3TER9_VIGRR|nr:defensin-like protein 1 [Vigna radiata var. radiata]
MEMRKSCAIFFLLLLLVFASQVVVQTEGRVCESQSHGFKGPCNGDHNCALVCRNEGFSGGNCRGFRRRCFCTKIC